MITTQQIEDLDAAMNLAHELVSTIDNEADVEALDEVMTNAESVLSQLSGWEERHRLEMSADAFAQLMRFAVDGVRTGYVMRTLEENECEELYTAVRFLESVFNE